MGARAMGYCNEKSSVNAVCNAMNSSWVAAEALIRGVTGVCLDPSSTGLDPAPW
jgi:hypothetical protein